MCIRDRLGYGSGSRTIRIFLGLGGAAGTGRSAAAGAGADGSLAVEVKCLRDKSVDVDFLAEGGTVDRPGTVLVRPHGYSDLLVGLR